MRAKRLNARKNDMEEMGNLPDGEIHETGEEIEVAYEEYPLIEGFELVDGSLFLGLPRRAGTDLL